MSEPDSAERAGLAGASVVELGFLLAILQQTPVPGWEEKLLAAGIQRKLADEIKMRQADGEVEEALAEMEAQPPAEAEPAAEQ